MTQLILNALDPKDAEPLPCPGARGDGTKSTDERVGDEQPGPADPVTDVVDEVGRRVGDKTTGEEIDKVTDPVDEVVDEVFGGGRDREQDDEERGKRGRDRGERDEGQRQDDRREKSKQRRKKRKDRD